MIYPCGCCEAATSIVGMVAADDKIEHNGIWTASDIPRSFLIDNQPDKVGVTLAQSYNEIIDMITDVELPTVNMSSCANPWL